jgi:ATP-binding cassette subfamily C protein CydCD
VSDPPRPVELPDGPRALVMRGVRARHPGQRRWALDGVDLNLAPGARVAVVGPSGAGKSTLAWTLLRFLPYASGSITLDGVELTDLDGEQVRRAIGLVSQDAHVFDSTIEANLRVALPSADEGQLQAALAEARLLEWVQSLPLGLATELGERGARMSGGQRQRLALARALLADFPVLILDEPAEHLDAATARSIEDDLLEGARARSVLLITHRLDGLERFDEIVFLARGRVLERGSRAELLAPAAAMWRSGAGWT